VFVQRERRRRIFAAGAALAIINLSNTSVRATLSIELKLAIMPSLLQRVCRSTEAESQRDESVSHLG
jgi:hypothetical protein